jgi:glycerophosphoryl diester phosphodiesterase
MLRRVMIPLRPVLVLALSVVASACAERVVPPSDPLGGEPRVALSDPDRHLPFAITNHFSDERALTGADLDVETARAAGDGTLWVGDALGPFLLHADARGRLLEPPIPLPDPDDPARALRSPRSPRLEEASTVRVLGALRAHAAAHDARHAPVCSPWHLMLADGDPETSSPKRRSPPPGSGVAAASSEIHDVAAIRAAGFPVVPYTVNDPTRMRALLALGVDGIITDRPDLLLAVVESHDADGDGAPGDLLDAHGLIDVARLDAQGHRGARNLRPENTLPAFEAALDALVTTLELDVAITADGVAVVTHDPYLRADKCRRADGTPYTADDEMLVRARTLAEIQSELVCDRLLADRPDQANDPALSPVATAFAAEAGLAGPYVMPTLHQALDFAAAYARHHRSGPGAAHPDAARRARNAERVRFNVETKDNPRPDRDARGRVFAERTAPPDRFVALVGETIVAAGLADRATIQSFDWRLLLLVHERFPAIRTAALFGDFPVLFDDPAHPDSGDGTNLQPVDGVSPWLAGLPWPYRAARPDGPPDRVAALALGPGAATLLVLLDAPGADAADGELLVHELDVATRRYTGVRHPYRLAPGSVAIADLVMTGDGRGRAVERDDAGRERVYEITLRGPDRPVGKRALAEPP